MATEPKVRPESNASRMLTKKLPDLAIKLSKVYEFNINGENVTLVADPVIADTSYLAEQHQTLVDVTNEIALSKKHSIELPPGVTIIIGKSGSGKTKLALERMTALNDNVIYARHGEPLDRHFVKDLMKDATSSGQMLLPFEVDVANAIAGFLFQEGSDVLIIDSLRYLFYAGGGATGKGGVNMTLFADISYLDVVANQRGKSLVVIINPLTDDDASYKSIIEAAKGSVSALIDVQSTTSIRYTSRYEERDFKSMALPEITRDSEGAKQQTKADSARSISLNQYSK